MAELVEGAALEKLYTSNGIKGSNPFLSAVNASEQGRKRHNCLCRVGMRRVGRCLLQVDRTTPALKERIPFSPQNYQ